MYSDKWFEKSISSAEKTLRTDVSSGLSRKEASLRRQKNGANVIFDIPRTSFRAYLGQMMTDFTFLLLLITIVIAILMERDLLLLPMIGVMVFYQICSVFCYVRAQRVIENMGDHALPNARVMRDGKLYMVKQSELVRGDIIFLSEGDIVPCDARLVASEGLEVLETNLTGVQRTVPKNAEFVGYGDLSPAQQKNMLFASTILTKGRGKAIVCEIGKSTLVCMMEKNQPIVNHENLKILDFIRKFSRFWSLVMICTVFAAAVLDLIVSRNVKPLFETFLTSLSLAVSSMSEFLAAFGFLIVACGVFSAVKKYGNVNSGAMIKDIGKLEDLRDITALILPIQGVFTVGEPNIELVYANHKEYTVSSKGYGNQCGRLLRYALLSTGLYGGDNLLRETSGGRDGRTSEENALVSEAERLGIYNKVLESEFPMLEHIASAPGARYDVTLIRSEGENRIAMRGDPSEILDRCKYFAEDGKLFPMTPGMRSEFRILCAGMMRRSLRVVAIASGETPYQRLLRLNYILKDLVFEGFVAFRESILPGSAALVGKCRENGIKVFLATDDENESCVKLARAVGVIDSEAQAVTGKSLAGKKEGILHIELPEYRLFQGLDLSQKRMLVRSLQENGEKVGVLAHNLNEIILLKEADVGFSQSVSISDRAENGGIDLSDGSFSPASAGGCEALKFVSDVIVSEASEDGSGGFSAVIRSVLCGKNIFLGFHKMIAYLLTTQTARILLVLYSIISGNPLLTPFQILYSGLFVDFLAIVIIAFTPASASILSRRTVEWEDPFFVFLSHWQYLLVGLFCSAFTALIPTVLSAIGVPLGDTLRCGTVFLSFLITQVLCLYGISRDKMLRFRGIRLTTMTLFALFVEILIPVLGICFPSFGKWIGICPLPSAAWIGIGIVNLLILAVLYVLAGIRAERKTEK